MTAIGKIPRPNMRDYGQTWVQPAADRVDWSRCRCERDQGYDDGTLGVRCLKCAKWIRFLSSTPKRTRRVYLNQRKLSRASKQDLDGMDMLDDDGKDMSDQIRRLRSAAVRDPDADALAAAAGPDLMVTAGPNWIDFSTNADHVNIDVAIDELLKATLGPDYERRILRTEWIIPVLQAT